MNAVGAWIRGQLQEDIDRDELPRRIRENFPDADPSAAETDMDEFPESISVAPEQ